MSTASTEDGRREVIGLEERRAELAGVLAQLPTLVAAIHRHRTGQEPIEPPAGLSPMAGFLFMLHGTEPSAEDLRVFEACQILQMEHGFNASTFTARVVASTLAPVHAVLAAAIGALRGVLHGGADEAAFRMARDEIGAPGEAAAYVARTLAAGGKIMGVGHRVYRTVDPRARILKRMARELAERKGGDPAAVYATLERVEEAVSEHMKARGKEIHANVEFYKGPVFYALGIPPELFTSMFVMARSFGWAAHTLELWSDHRLYRPRGRYVGAGL